MKISQLTRFARHHGLVRAGFNVGYKVANRAFTVMILKVLVLTVDSVNQSLIAGEDDRWRFLSKKELQHFSRLDPSLELDDEFLAIAVARGDHCFAFVQDGVLGAYGWYSKHPTPISDSLTVKFDPDYVYMYKGFTAPAFRGLRLHGIGMARAMLAFVEQASKGLISYVEANNQDSLKSCERIGYMTVGTAAIAGVGLACVSYASKGCRPFGFRVRVGRSRWL